MTNLSPVISLLHIIIANQNKPPPFSVGQLICSFFALAMAYVIAQAANNAFVLAFSKIPVGGGLLGAFIYLIIILPIGVFVIWAIVVYLQPWLQKKLDR